MKSAWLQIVLIAALFFALSVVSCGGGDDDTGGDDDASDDDTGAPDADVDPPAPPAWPDPSLREVFDLNVGETAAASFDGGVAAEITLMEVTAQSDAVRGAVRASTVRLAVDGEPVNLDCGNYHLPVDAGAVRVDCPVTRDVYANTNEDRWGLEKDARLRVWPGHGSLTGGAPLTYPLAGQRWLANRTQSGNEPTDDYLPFLRSIYYHSGFDLGGVDGVDPVVAAARGRVVLANGEVLPGYEETPARLQDWLFQTRTDVVYVEDERGWFYRYSHLDRSAPSLALGDVVAAGDLLGYLGNNGESGGWAHLHFEIIARQPSGLWGVEESYAYLWEGYVKEREPAVIAVARPHRFGVAGDTIVLDGSKSVALDGEIVSYRWLFTDGDGADGVRVERTYNEPGFFTEMLEVTDEAGRKAYDAATVQIVHATNPHPFYTYMHAAHSPSADVAAGDEVLFSVRVFGIGGGEDVWDFGDGSPPEITQAGNWPIGGDYATITHRYDAPGDYLVRVDRVNDRGEPCVARLWVPVRE
ncbi:MAG: PKD domain-containing protein [Deltaproteobacteria bacterium]|nr:PKD domain-containing protein [Deltaproteobacteria bacterium]